MQKTLAAIGISAAIAFAPLAALAQTNTTTPAAGAAPAATNSIARPNSMKSTKKHTAKKHHMAKKEKAAKPADDAVLRPLPPRRRRTELSRATSAFETSSRLIPPDKATFFVRLSLFPFGA